MKTKYFVSRNTKFSEDYKFIRNLLNMTLPIFGDFIGVSYKTISRIEKTSKVSKRTLSKTLKSISAVFYDKQLVYSLEIYKLDELTRFKNKIETILGGTK